MSAKFMFYFGSFLACTTMALTSGCASGGFKLTREYAGFVNKQSLIVRIILYILTGVVFVATLLIDMVIFNTMDFWDGKVSQGTYDFKSGDRTFQARHEILPHSGLRHSTIQVFAKDHVLLQEVVLNETLAGEIEMFVDGQMRARVRDIKALPTVAIFDVHGKLIGDKTVPGVVPNFVERLLAWQ